MNNFTSIHDVTDLSALLQTAQDIKELPFAHEQMGRQQSMCLLFFNASLRTRLSTQQAAFRIGLHTVVFDINAGGWNLEFEDGTVMKGDKAEHVKEAAAVIGAYFDIIGIRTFAGLKDREEDYAERVIEQFVRYSGKPVINLESPTRHPLQSFTDLITIEEYKQVEKPKVVLSWAPHPRALPQAVANSFVEWMKQTDYNLVITHPPGYELAKQFTEGVPVVYNQMEAFADADFIYTKNWSAYDDYGKILQEDSDWMVTQEKMKLTNNARFMHCLPVRRNVIVEDAVLDSDRSIVIPQAANRMVAAQAVLQTILQSTFDREL